jgi:CRP-like cAMP-binding protein
MIYNILLIEDNKDLADNVASILELAGYNVTLAENGNVGVDMALQKHPDLILCDIVMPGLDGFGVAHILNNDPETTDIPFIFLTARADRSDFRRGMDLGADDYITKPFEDVDLLHVIETRLKKRAQLKAILGNNHEDVSAFFSKANEIREFHKLSKDRRSRFFKKRDILFMEGQIPNDLFYIEKGSVKTYKVSYDGKELITHIYKAGDFLGYVPLFEGRPYNQNAEALEDVKILVIPKSDFLSIAYVSKDVARKFIEILSNNLEEMENRLLEIAYFSIRQRVASALLKINKEGSRTKKINAITIARKDISNIVGTAIESLNRTLGDFKDEGLIEISGEGIRIVDRPRLEKTLY